ncbi:hypothetical protein [Kitasatospora sp. NPDC047058]|uniref:hypothetical protein n=1 Tax=Kitasatospora sp. NPDC047058 TaxID=3155620 RepID=UPI0033EB3541
MTRRRTPNDPTARSATTNALELSDMAAETATVMIEMIGTVMMSNPEVLKYTGKSRQELYQEFRKRMARARHPQGWNVSAELRDLADGLPPEMKAAVRALEQSLLRPCEQCQQPVPPPSRSGGRPRRFCSNACRQKAHRQRTRDQPTT